MVKIMERCKNIYGALPGYHAPECRKEVSDIYEARAYVKKQLELYKVGDDKWHEAQQNFDAKSVYLTDGYSILWYEFIEE